jgi:N6-L-threonylcarbamoyladenine synthase
MVILGIETSCDETSAAIVDNGVVVANEVYTQDMHAAYGGVVPEIASRAHLEKIENVVLHVLDHAGISREKLDGIAVTDRPGLAGALLVGISFAWGMHTRWNIPVTGVNHLEGHICSVCIDNPDIAYPFIALVVSGGHTEIYRVDAIGRYALLGETVDDAAGEAFDKVGSLLGFSYPAGREIEQQARKATSGDTHARPSFPVSRLSKNGTDFSFSGLKTAVRYYIEHLQHAGTTVDAGQVCAAFQTAVLDSLLQALDNAVRRTGIDRVAAVGGVACNGALREALQQRFSTGAYMPPKRLCTDNAAMIAYAGWQCFVRGETRRPAMHPAGRL